MASGYMVADVYRDLCIVKPLYYQHPDFGSCDFKLKLTDDGGMYWDEDD